MDIHLVSTLGFLRIHPVLPEFMKELTMKVKHVPVTEKEIVTRNGETRTIKQRSNQVQILAEPLYSLHEGYLYTHDGMLHRMLGLIHRMGLKANYVRTPPAFPQPRISPALVEGLREEQVEAVIALLAYAATGGAIMDSTVGSGKTRVIAAIIRAFPDQNIIVTTGLASVVQRLYTGLNELLNPYDIRVGIMQGANKAPRRVTVATSALLDRIDPDEHGLVLYDEVDEAASPSRSAALIRFNKAIRYGFTGTLNNRFDGKEMWLEALFGPTAFVFTDQQAEALGRVCPVRAWALSVEEGPDIGAIKDPVRQARVGIWRNDRRNRLIREVVDRVPADQQVLVFVSKEEHLNELKLKFLPEFEIYHGGMPDGEKRRLLPRVESGEAKRVIATNSLARGIDPKAMYVLIDANWESSEGMVLQRNGRNRRHADDKDWGVLVVFEDGWSDTARRKAVKRIGIYKSKGYEVNRHARPADIEFVGVNSYSSLLI